MQHILTNETAMLLLKLLDTCTIKGGDAIQYVELTQALLNTVHECERLTKALEDANRELTAIKNNKENIKEIN